MDELYKCMQVNDKQLQLHNDRDAGTPPLLRSITYIFDQEKEAPRSLSRPRNSHVNPTK